MSTNRVDPSVLAFHRELERKLVQIEQILAPLKMGHVLTLIARATTAPTNDGDIVLTKETDIEDAVAAARKVNANPSTVVPARKSER